MRLSYRHTIIGLAVLSCLVAATPLRALFMSMAEAFDPMPDHVQSRPAMLAAHAAAAAIALAVGPFQFLPALRSARPALHRWLGRLYAAAVLVGAISGLVLALHATGGEIAGVGFGLLAIGWALTTALAVRAVLLGRIDAHRRWMARSFALTFAAVSLRLQLPILFASGLDYAEASRILAWSCWLPNLLVVELALSRFFQASGALSRQRLAARRAL